MDENVSTLKKGDSCAVTMKTASGKEVGFAELASIVYQDNRYAILQPMQLLGGTEEDEAIVFKVSMGGDGKKRYEAECEDAVIDAVIDIYNDLLDEIE